MKALFMDVYKDMIMGIHMRESLGQIGRRYKGEKGRHEEVSRMAHLADGLCPKYSGHVQYI
jgi:hypothetical protein